MQLFLSNTSLLSSAPALSKDLSNGGQEGIEHTTDTRTQNLIHTMLTRVRLRSPFSLSFLLIVLSGFWFSHIGWIILRPRRKQGVADISDLSQSPVVEWQHNNFVSLIIVMAFIFPTVVAGLGWGDWKGGFVYAAVLRLVFVHHVRPNASCSS